VLNDYFDEWVEARLVKGRPLSESTKHHYKKLWRSHIANSLGKKTLRAVTVAAGRSTTTNARSLRRR